MFAAPSKEIFYNDEQNIPEVPGPEPPEVSVLVADTVLAVVAGVEEGGESLRVPLVQPQLSPLQQHTHHTRVSRT
jgi:hypothetical protein